MNEIKLPQLGQSVEEAYIVEWFKQEGDEVSEGEPLFSVQTDKAEIECEATAAGVLRKIIVETDVTVAVLAVVALVGTADEPLPDLSAYAVPETAPASSASVAPVAAPAAQTPQAAAISQEPAGGPVSPRARRRAKALHVSPDVIPGTGVGGRVMESDVEAYAANASATRSTPMARRVAARDGVDLRTVQGSGNRITKSDVASAGYGAIEDVEGTVVPLTPMRRIVAQRMAESYNDAPHYFVTVEIDMQAAVQHRASCDPKPSFNDLVLQSVARSLRVHPLVNARWMGDAIAEMDHVHLGVAVALDGGLVVPVLRDADKKSVQEIHDACAELIDKARNNKLLPDDFQGSTFTVSNLGPFGVDDFTAIINQPNSAILAVGAMKDRVVAVDGEIVIRPIMRATISSDHRVVDGALAAQFMKTLKQEMETADFS
jgi:pyruvate dehydrogenase E2 component (dihydrolipoamide acetyltransferase)